MLRSYDRGTADRMHSIAYHTIEYIRNNVDTRMEDFWSLFKHTSKGTYMPLSRSIHTHGLWSLPSSSMNGIM
jgi:hypothetical protein